MPGRVANSRPNTIVHDTTGWWLVLEDRKGRERARARISRQDVPLVRTRRWCLTRYGYATTSTRVVKRVLLHRLLMNAPKGRQVDQKNGNRLDCRRSNLRVVPRGGNAQNVVRQNLTTGHRNVEQRRRGGPFYVRVEFRGVVHKGGTFVAIEEAIKAARVLRAKVFPYVNEERH